MKTIAANELKTRGVSSIEKALEGDVEATISVRGQERYIVMAVEEYNRLRVLNWRQPFMKHVNRLLGVNSSMRVSTSI